MFKTGIYNIEGLLAPDCATTLFRKELKNVSLSLYEKACDLAEPDEITQRILLLSADERGAYKRTYSKRFEEFDQKIVALIAEEFKGNSLSVHDVGVSDARTSVDFFYKLKSKYNNLDYIASDYNPAVKIIEHGKLKIVLSENSDILEITYPPFVFNMHKRDSYRHYPLNHLIKKIIYKLYVTPVMRSYSNGEILAREIYICSARAVQLAKSNIGFKLAQQNILAKIHGKYNVVRAMNILNESYFNKQQTQQAIRNICEALDYDGIFVVGSNQGVDSKVHGGVYKLNGTDIDCIWHSGNGFNLSKYIT